MQQQAQQLITLHRDSFRMMRVKRWRKTWEKLFRSWNLIRLIREDNLHHCGSMVLMSDLVFDAALKLGDTSIIGLNDRIVRTIIWLHDAEEIFVGDHRSKDAAYYRREKRARGKLRRYFTHLGYARLPTLMDRYKKRATAEDRFVKVLDELQAWNYMLALNITHETTRDFSQPQSIEAYRLATEFPLLQAIADLLLAEMQQALNTETAPV